MDSMELIKFAAALLFVHALMGGLAFFLKRLGAWRAGGFICKRKKTAQNH
jgi:hypothetical protein